MKLLLILLSMMSFTVQTKSTVSMEGTWPYSIEVEYANTYQKGTVREGDVAALNLNELGGMSIERVEVYVRSNSTAGAGRFEVRANGYTVNVIAGTFKDWVGAYDAQNYHVITLVSGSVPNVYSLSIQLIGTTNSLYIEKYVITYGSAPAKSVTLMSGSTSAGSLREEVGGAGVLLPKVDNIGRWKFVGWTDTEFEERSEMPYLYYPYKMYYPEEDCTLWAVYLYDYTPERVYVTELEDGEYLYANRLLDIALTGIPNIETSKMDWDMIDVHNEYQYYTIEFASPDTAYITHSYTGMPIGVSGTKMATVPSPWLVYHEGDETIFYTVIGGKNYVLWLNIWDGTSESFYAGLLQANPSSSPMGLLPACPRGAPRYSCHPERLMQGVESTQYSEVSSQKVLHNGQVLIIRDGKTYTIQGIKLKE